MEPLSPRRWTRAVLLLLLAALPLAVVAATRLEPPNGPAVAWLPWASIGLAVAAGLAGLGGLVHGLRAGMLAPLLRAGASAALAGGAIALLSGAPSLAVPLLGAGALLVAGAISDRLGAMVHSRQARLGAAACVFLAAEGVVLAGLLPAAAEALEPLHAPMLALTAVVALIAGLASAGRPPMLVAASVAAGAAALVIGRSGGIEILIGLVTLTGSQLAGLHSLLSDAPPADEERGLPELATRLNDAVLRFDGRLQLRDWNAAAGQMLGLDTASAGSRLEDLLGVSIAQLPPPEGAVTHRGAIGGLEISLHRSGEGLTAIVRDPRGTPELERLGRELRGTIEELLQ